jgi:hypothetical protein
VLSTKSLRGAARQKPDNLDVGSCESMESKDVTGMSLRWMAARPSFLLRTSYLARNCGQFVQPPRLCSIPGQGLTVCRLRIFVSCRYGVPVRMTGRDACTSMLVQILLTSSVLLTVLGAGQKYRVKQGVFFKRQHPVFSC